MSISEVIDMSEMSYDMMSELKKAVFSDMGSNYVKAKEELADCQVHIWQ